MKDSERDDRYFVYRYSKFRDDDGGYLCPHRDCYPDNAFSTKQGLGAHFGQIHGQIKRKCHRFSECNGYVVTSLGFISQKYHNHNCSLNSELRSKKISEANRARSHSEATKSKMSESRKDIEMKDWWKEKSKRNLRKKIRSGEYKPSDNFNNHKRSVIETGRVVESGWEEAIERALFYLNCSSSFVLDYSFSFNGEVSTSFYEADFVDTSNGLVIEPHANIAESCNHQRIKDFQSVYGGDYDIVVLGCEGCGEYADRYKSFNRRWISEIKTMTKVLGPVLADLGYPLKGKEG